MSPDPVRSVPIGMITMPHTRFHFSLLRAESRTEYSCTASGAPGASSSSIRASPASRSFRLRTR